MTQLYNHLEIVIWTILGVFCFAIGITKPRGSRGLFLIAAIDLIAFGISDYFEAAHGNQWWRPWWLLMWKVTCIAVLLSILVIGIRRRRSVPSPGTPGFPRSRGRWKG